MSEAPTGSSYARWLCVALVVVAAAIAIRNATVYPAIAGFDASEALEYARDVVDGRLPAGTGSYYTPPGFFAVGGVALELGDRLGLEHPERVGQIVNALAAVGTLLLLLVLVRILWPGRQALHVAALGFFVACPIVFKSAAMFHPEPLSMLLSTVALVLAAHLLTRPDYRIRTAIALGMALGLAQLVRAWTLWTLGVVVLVLVVAWVTRRGDRRPLLAVIAVVLLVAVAVPSPWYVHQLRTYHSALFGQETPDEPVWSRRPLTFYVAGGLPDVISQPYRPAFSKKFIPLVYAETWGDYFATWRWLVQPGSPSKTVRRELVAQSLVGLPFTAIAVAGWLALLFAAARHPGRRSARHLVALLPLAALVGVAYFATAYPTPDGDTAKAGFMLTAVPAWAACFGFGIDGLRARFPRLFLPLVAVLVVLGLVSVWFGRAVGMR